MTKDKSKQPQTIDHILDDWPFDPAYVNVRLCENRSREVLQMRIDMGVLQLEIDGRPDGLRPHGKTSFYDYLKQKAKSEGEFVLNSDECQEVDREFVQYYHRRVCWLQLKEFDKAVQDADHTLGLMDLCKECSPDQEWTISHEQYRPFVLYHRTQAAALAALSDEDGQGAELAIDEVERGLSLLQDLFEEYDAGEQFEEDELVVRLQEFKENLKSKYGIEEDLEVQLADAVANENYELAARLRDRIAERNIMSESDFDESEVDFMDE